MTTWATTEYTEDGEGRLVETHRDLRPAELRDAVYAVEASTDHGRGWASNGLRWTAAIPAGHWASGLAMRWFGCTDIRVVELADSPPMGSACRCTALPGAHTDDEHPTLYTVKRIVRVVL